MEAVFNGLFVPSGLRKHLEAVIDMAEEEGEKESFCEGGEENKKRDGEREALVKQLKTCHGRLKGLSSSAE